MKLKIKVKQENDAEYEARQILIAKFFYHFGRVTFYLIIAYGIYIGLNYYISLHMVTMLNIIQAMLLAR